MVLYSGLIMNTFVIELSCYFKNLTSHYCQNQIYFKSLRVWISDLIGRRHLNFVYLVIIIYLKQCPKYGKYFCLILFDGYFTLFISSSSMSSMIQF